MTIGEPNPEPGLESTLTLFHRAKDGSQVALNRLYARFLPRLSRWAAGRLSPGVRQVHDTSDIVQDVLVRFLGRIEDVNPQHPGALMAYLRTSVMNRVRDLERQAGRRPIHVDAGDATIQLPDPASSPFESIVARETADRYETALATLEDEERAAVIMRIELDFSTAEIAEELGKPSTDAARMFLHRSILKLAKQMNRPGARSPGC